MLNKVKPERISKNLDHTSNKGLKIARKAIQKLGGEIINKTYEPQFWGYSFIRFGETITGYERCHRKEILAELYSILELERAPGSNIFWGFERMELASILYHLKDWKAPENFELKGKTPKMIKLDIKGGRREEICDFIEKNFGILIKSTTMVTLPAYNSMLEYLLSKTE